MRFPLPLLQSSGNTKLPRIAGYEWVPRKGCLFQNKMYFNLQLENMAWSCTIDLLSPRCYTYLSDSQLVCARGPPILTFSWYFNPGVSNSNRLGGHIEKNEKNYLRILSLKLHIVEKIGKCLKILSNSNFFYVRGPQWTLSRAVCLNSLSFAIKYLLN